VCIRGSIRPYGTRALTSVENALSLLLESTDVTTKKYVCPATTFESVYEDPETGALVNFVYGPPDMDEEYVL
jgi:hypothetical protein